MANLDGISMRTLTYYNGTDDTLGTRLDVLFGMLKEVLAEKADQKRDRSARDGAMRKTVWAANSLGPTILLILLGLLQHWGLK